jgi:hypothetical protein
MYLRREVEVVPQILDSLVGKIPVIVTPGKLLSDVSPRFQGLNREQDI